ncbi:hypothetical protein Srufu_008700 [Streptomyces libani subsp. rufus]|nr:hypothetical protein Srufu_008700 [Streptomyces libani subsp. rufus]
MPGLPTTRGQLREPAETAAQDQMPHRGFRAELLMQGSATLRVADQDSFLPGHDCPCTAHRRGVWSSQADQQDQDGSAAGPHLVGVVETPRECCRSMGDEYHRLMLELIISVIVLGEPAAEL